MEATDNRARPTGMAVAVLTFLSVCVVLRAWAQDGGRIVFAGHGGDGATNIYITTPDGAQVEQLTFHDGKSGWASDPAWSPDGRQIAFSSSRKWVTQRIYVMDADASNQRLISDGVDDGHHDTFPSWSPRGHAVAFSSIRWPNSAGVYMTGVQGGPDTRLTDLDTVSYRPSWRPFGDAIAYSSDREGVDGIHFMDGQGRHGAQLPDGVPSGREPTWHPREDAIAFRKFDAVAANHDIHTINIDGSGERRVTKHPAWDSSPCWSPDGTQILFESARDGGNSNRLFITDPDGRNVRRVTDGRFLSISGASWFDADVPRSVSPIGRRATTWGWLKGLAGPVP